MLNWLHCLCHRGWNNKDMIECIICSNWYHIAYVKTDMSCQCHAARKVLSKTQTDQTSHRVGDVRLRLKGYVCCVYSFCCVFVVFCFESHLPSLAHIAWDSHIFIDTRYWYKPSNYVRLRLPIHPSHYGSPWKLPNILSVSSQHQIKSVLLS